MLLLTDGRVLIQNQGKKNTGSSDWWVLSPDAKGNYTDGTWAQAASLPSTYAPLYFADAVLPDGRVVIEGGEYNHGIEDWTNKGAIYDPIANTWTMITPPTGSGWSRIGDGPGTVLASGQFMLGASGFSGTTAEATLNATTLSWAATGAGKADGNGEEGWSLLPDGQVLTVDTTGAPNTEVYTPSTGSWTSAGAVPAPLVDAIGEVGPQTLMPNGQVLAVGATGNTDLYNTATGVWSAGPTFPVIAGQQYDSADGPAAVLPNGEVLIDASPGDYQLPSAFFVYDPTGSTLTQIASAPNAAAQQSNFGYMLMLPNGQVLFNERCCTTDPLYLYTGGGHPSASWRPTITSVPTTLVSGTSYTVSGLQLNGLTQDSAYGDDYQSATNYPLVRVTNDATGDVIYARTSAFSTMTVAPQAPSSATFTLPGTVETGASTLVVIANGIASSPVAVTVQ